VSQYDQIFIAAAVSYYHSFLRGFYGDKQLIVSKLLISYHRWRLNVNVSYGSISLRHNQSISCWIVYGGAFSRKHSELLGAEVFGAVYDPFLLISFLGSMCSTFERSIAPVNFYASFCVDLYVLPLHRLERRLLHNAGGHMLTRRNMVRKNGLELWNILEEAVDYSSRGGFIVLAVEIDRNVAQLLLQVRRM